jgi:hypothetical protein
LRCWLTLFAEGCSGAWPAVTSTPLGGIFGSVHAALFRGQSTRSYRESAKCGPVVVGVLTDSPRVQTGALYSSPSYSGNKCLDSWCASAVDHSGSQSDFQPRVFVKLYRLNEFQSLHVHWFMVNISL